MAIARTIARRLLEDGFSGLGVGDVGSAFAVDAAAATLAVQFSAAFTFCRAAVDRGLGTLPLGPGLGMGAVVGGGGGHERRLVLPEHCHFALERHSGVLRSAPAQL